MTHRLVSTRIGERRAAAAPTGVSSALVAIISLASALAFAFLGREVGEAATTNADRRLLRDVIGWTHAWPLPLVKAVTDLGTAPAIIVVTLVVVVQLTRGRRWPDIVVLVVAAIGAILLSTVTKNIFARPRPVEFFRVYAPPNSFPSGHTLNAASMALALGFVLWRSETRRGARIAGTAALAVYAACVGASRVVLGVHYPTDVLGGYLLAIAWVALLTAVARGAEHWRTSRRSGAADDGDMTV